MSSLLSNEDFPPLGARPPSPSKTRTIPLPEPRTSVPLNPTPLGPKKSKRTILDVDEDILHLIVTELLGISPTTLPALARVSVTFNSLVTPYIWRYVKISPRTTDPLVQRLRGEDGRKFAQHVRHLQVNGVPEVATLEEVMDKCSNLKRFSWNSNQHIPDSILQKLHKNSPDAELFVRTDRCHASGRAHQTIDDAIISSPQLASLCYTIFIHPRNSGEWLQLHKALMSARRCKNIRLHVREDGYRYRIPSPDSTPAASPLTSTLPHLEELVVYQPSWHYPNPWSPEQSHFLRDCLRASSLQRVDFGDTCPSELFDQIVRLPRLKHLRLGLPLEVQFIDQVATLLYSLHGLETLDISRMSTNFDQIWPAIKKHKRTLKGLVLRPSGWSGYPTGVDHVLEIGQNFPLLERLGIFAPFEELFPDEDQIGQQKRKNKAWIPQSDGSLVDPDYAVQLAKLNLKALDLFFQIPQKATTFSAELRQNAYGSIPAPALDVSGAQKTGAALMDKISAGQKRPLQVLTMHIARVGFEDRCQAYLMQATMQMRRNERDDADALGEQKYRVVGDPRWFNNDVEDLLALEY